MELSGLFTSAGINILICIVLFSLYSILRKQPSNRGVYFARTIAQMKSKKSDPYWYDRFVPSPRWIVRAWELTDSEILSIGGLDALAFVRALVFSIRIFFIAAIVCLALVLPLNYLGKEAQHKQFLKAESLEVFTIQNVKEGSDELWAHCLALYIVCCSAWILLYSEYRYIARLRLQRIHESSERPSLFAVLYRGIPKSSPGGTYSHSLKKFLKKYYRSYCLSYQMVYKCGNMLKLMKQAKDVCELLSVHGAMQNPQCRYCQAEMELLSTTSSSEKGQAENMKPSSSPFSEKGEAENVKLSSPPFNERGEVGYGKQSSPSFSEKRKAKKRVKRKKCKSIAKRPKGRETSAAFVFFKTRFAAQSAAQSIQSSNPMFWVTDPAPEPNDIYWPNLCIPYRQLWMRKAGTFLATGAFLIFFLGPVTLVQSLANLKQLQMTFPFLRSILQIKPVAELVTGYLPSVILVLFFYMVPPLMMFFSTVEGSISRSRKKKATCLKILYFTVWNIFFVNLVSGTLINKLSIIANPKDIPKQLAARAVPALVKFFMTYVMTSGWTSLACELVQLYPLVCNHIYKLVTRYEVGPYESGWTFPFHTEVPRVLLFGLLGFSFGVIAPMIVPLVLIYFCLAYAVYRNQILNVYLFEYDTGGLYWPIVHNTTIFSMVLAQVLAIGFFAMKDSPTCMVFTILLIVFTLLFNEYCRHRFLPVFERTSAQDLIDLDQQDDPEFRLEIYNKLENVYSQREWIEFEDTEGSGFFTSNAPEQGVCVRHQACEEKGDGTDGHEAESYDLEEGKSPSSHGEGKHQRRGVEGGLVDGMPVEPWPRPPPPPPIGYWETGRGNPYWLAPPSPYGY